MNGEPILMAEQQLRGYHHAACGYSITSLADEMGLTKSEWRALREGSFLRAKDIAELDEHFGIKPKNEKGAKG